MSRQTEPSGAGSSSDTPPVIQTKLHRPPTTDDHVRRDRLNASLDAARNVPLTLVSAPAGYGKSMLVSQWAEAAAVPCAWLSLDESDSDLRTFLTYLVAAIEKVVPGTCHRSETLCAVPELPTPEVLAGHLINELDAVDELLVIVIDDYHCIEHSSKVQTLMGALLSHPPRDVHLILTTRRDPPLELTRLRAGNQVVEVRLHELRFTKAETEVLLADKAGFQVSGDALDHLQHEVEGWAAGLRLVLLALARADNADDFLKGLHGGIPHMQEYLLKEVLAGLSDGVRSCMLKSSVVDRFCPELLEAICSPGESEAPIPGGQEIVDLLSGSNAFTIALDARGEWFRFHHLFQDLLKRQLEKHSTTEDIGTLHLHASEWFEGRGLVHESIRHALAAGDVVRAAEVIERRRDAELEADHWYIVGEWLEMLPEDIKQERLGLLIAQAWVVTFHFDFERLSAVLERIDTILEHTQASLPERAELAYFHGLLNYYMGNGEESLRRLVEARKFYPTDRGMIAGEIEMYLALARHMNGDGAAAIADIRAKQRMAMPGDGVYLARLVGTEGFIQALSPGFLQAEPAAGRVTRIGRESGNCYIEAWGRYLEALVHFHSFRLDDALRAFRDVVELQDFLTRKVGLEALSGAALTHQFMQNPDAARAAVNEVTSFARDAADPELLLAAESCRARVQILQGEIRPALDWAGSVDAEPSAAAMSFWLENPALTKLRAAVAGGSDAGLGAACETLRKVRGELEGVRSVAQAIEVAVLQVVASKRRGRTDEALVGLESALALAETCGWVRPFVEAGAPMAVLLETIRGWGGNTGFIDRVLAAYPDRGPDAVEAVLSDRAGTTHTEGALTPDVMTDREIEILELLARRLNNKEISARLFISTHTVNDHLKHIYDKLDVHSRREAVVRAIEAGILDRTSSG